MMEKLRKVFSGMPITIMGLGRLGRGEKDCQFLASLGAEITVTDHADEETLQPVLDRLAPYPIRYVLGRHERHDFITPELILRSAAVPPWHPLLCEAYRAGVEVRMDEGLLVRYLSKKVQVIGITGSRGKTTTATLIAHILKRKTEKHIFLSGNIQGEAAFPLLGEISEPENTCIVLEMSSWQLQDWDYLSYSPSIAVFTNFYPDHLDYYKGDMERYLRDKVSIFRHQKKTDILIGHLTNKMQRSSFQHHHAKLVTREEPIKKDRPLWDKGKDSQMNAELAAEVCKHIGINESDINDGISTFKGVAGRREHIGTWEGCHFINDTCASTPIATAYALYAFPKNSTFIMGGKDKGLPFEELGDAFAQCQPKIVLLASGQKDESDGTGRIKEYAHRHGLAIKGPYTSMDESVHAAIKWSSPSSWIVLSPAMASFGMYANAYDRGERYQKAIQAYYGEEKPDLGRPNL